MKLLLFLRFQRFSLKTKLNSIASHTNQVNGNLLKATQSVVAMVRRLAHVASNFRMMYEEKMHVDSRRCFINLLHNG